MNHNLNHKRKDLFKYLSMSVPYDLVVNHTNSNHNHRLSTANSEGKFFCVEESNNQLSDWFDIWSIKPYLRPLTSLTEDEAKELVVAYYTRYPESEITEMRNAYQTQDGSWLVEFDTVYHGNCSDVEFHRACMVGCKSHKGMTLAEIDWYLEHHIDIYGLIEKDQAIDVTTLKWNPYAESKE